MPDCIASTLVNASDLEHSIDTEQAICDGTDKGNAMREYLDLIIFIIASVVGSLAIWAAFFH